MNRTISNIERAAAARERMNQQCRTTEFRKFGARQRYEMGAYDTLLPSPQGVQPFVCADSEERRRLKAAVARLREAMYEWQTLCEEHFGLSPAFDDAAWEAIEQQLNTPKDKQMDAKEILKMMAESGGIRVAGDFVMEKHVQYEVANVENGGIGIMVGGEGQQSKPALQFPAALSTPAARALLQKVQAAGLLDEAFQPVGSNREAAIIADEISTKLGLSQQWAPFEELWGISNLRQSNYNANGTSKGGEVRDKIRNALK